MPDRANAPLAKLRESLQLALEADGPGGGPQVMDQLDAAVGYYSLHFSKYPPAELADEAHRTRALVALMLRQPQPDARRADLRRAAGWLSALVGNLAYVLGDYAAARIHLETAHRLGNAAGDRWLVGWSLGAKTMLANSLGSHDEALALSERALEYADTPLRYAQLLAWGRLRSLAAVGDRAEAAAVVGSAQDAMAADPEGDQPGRFGFDLTELRLHLAEAARDMGDHAECRDHAEASRAGLSPSRPAWAAATLVLARGEAARGRYGDAAALAAEVLDAVPAQSLRATSRERLRQLHGDLVTADSGVHAETLEERLRTMPPLLPGGASSDEPNGVT
ncbi:hypothetical protein BTM25_04260 [Actinomadura rubteroloni]|uniref:Tetratricopeptide repeat protein n=1 Tax=Actinomadura rubteroloni TaxID=1926885 RepID=A0A2P4ULX0_9ACTN|nr:hypothetical protein [Actinomadura rubteroloni]POM26042.1 hypothetical protein BTM25_04260 [Actinomadura rubteroloni]